MNNSKQTKYEAPFAEITEIDTVALLAWSGIHDTDTDPDDTSEEPTFDTLPDFDF